MHQAPVLARSSPQHQPPELNSSITGRTITSRRRPRRAAFPQLRCSPFLVVAVIACCVTRSNGFFPPVPSSAPGSAGKRTAGFRWGAATLSSRSNSKVSGNRRRGGGIAEDCVIAIEGRGRRRGELRMAAGEPPGPGKGTQVVLLRHGMSTFNKLNIFTGWCDVPLAEEGKIEALEAGKLLAAAGYRFDVAHSSVLKRACTSLHRLLEGSGQPYIPIKTSWRLNERHYGALQGRNKATLEEAMGDVVIEWRRAYGVRPPPMTETHPHWPLISLDSRYRGLTIPESESLRDTANRVMEYWESDVVPDIRAGKRVIVVAHANTLRSLVKRLDGVHEDAIRNVNIPTGEPFVYNFDADLRPMGEPDEHGFRGRFVGDMMGEKDAAVDEYKRREQACIDKWEENPELVPEECMCVDDMDDVATISATSQAERFGEAQTSLGLDRYSAGYDLPLPNLFHGSNDAGEASAVRAATDGEGKQGEVEVGGPILETMADLPGRREEEERNAGTMKLEEGGLPIPGSEQRMPDRNETLPARSV